MASFTIIDIRDGRILRNVFCEASWQSLQCRTEFEFPVSGEFNSLAQYALPDGNGDWQFPVRPGIAPLEVVIGQIDLSTLPVGTSISISNEAGDVLTVDQADGPIDLIDPGLYQMRVSPPFPWLDAIQEINHA